MSHSQSHSADQSPALSVPSGSRRHAPGVTEARARAQRSKLEAQQRRQRPETGSSRARAMVTQEEIQARRRASITLTRAIDDYLQDHEGGNHSPKTLEWHRTALGLLTQFLEQERAITLIAEVETADFSAWFTHLRKVPGTRGRMRSERTVQTYARSVRAFFHWLIRQEMLTNNPFDRVTFPKVGKPLIQTLSAEEFERLLLACTPLHESGPIAERAAVRNRAILWLLYDTGIRVSELCGLCLEQFDRKHAIITVTGKGSKQRRIALGSNCLRNLLYYLDRHRPDEEELAAWGSAGEEHLFLAETRMPLSKNGMEMLFQRIRKRSGISGKRISPHILRHTFAVRYLIAGGDPFSLQELLGHEDIETVKIYMRLNDDMIQGQKRKFSPGDHLPTRMPGPREARRKASRAKTAGRKTQTK